MAHSSAKLMTVVNVARRRSAPRNWSACRDPTTPRAHRVCPEAEHMNARIAAALRAPVGSLGGAENVRERVLWRGLSWRGHGLLRRRRSAHWARRVLARRDPFHIPPGQRKDGLPAAPAPWEAGPARGRRIRRPWLPPSEPDRGDHLPDPDRGRTAADGARAGRRGGHAGP